MNPARLYEAFHSEGVREAFELAVRWPDHPVGVGEVRSIVYRSDKWGDGLHDYEHRVEGKAYVFVDRRNKVLGDPARIGALPGLLPPRPTAKAARLGDSIELVVDRPDGKRARLNLDQGPRLYDSPAFVTFDHGGWHYYVAAADEGAIVIRSKTLRVTRRGLVG